MTQAALAPQKTSRLPRPPYKGLLPFTAEDADFFFGREVERELIAANLMAARLTVLYGPSGVGKTSVLDAGVAHDLTKLARETVDEEDTPNRALVVFRTWHGDPVAGLSAAVAEAVRALLPDRAFEDPSPDAALADVLAHWTRELDGRLLIVLDQFEEYFVYTSAGGRFDTEFPRAVNRADLRANFLVSIREDALAKLDRFKGRIPYLFDNYLRLDRLDLKAARLAIEGPLRRYAELGGDAVSIEPELVEDVLEQVRPDLSFGEAGTGTAEAGRPERIETTFLQLVMTKLWDTERQAGSNVLRASTLRGLDGAKGIVRSHLNEGIDQLDEDEKEVAARLFQFLVTRSGQKVAHTAIDLADFSDLPLDAVTGVLQRLARPDVRILRRVEAAAGAADDGARYEIDHDTLGEPILAWRSAYRESRSAAVERARTREALELARRARRRIIWATAAAALLLVTVVSLVLLIVAFDQRSAAIHARTKARAQKLTAESAATLAIDPDRAVRLAERALATKPLPEAERAFRTAVGFSPLRAEIRHDGDVYRTAYSADGRRVLALGEDTAIVADPRTGRRIETLRSPGHAGLLTGDLNRDGSRLLTAGADGTVRFWNVDRGAVLRTFASPFVTSARLDPADSREAVATAADGHVRAWRLGSRAAWTSSPTSNALRGLVFSPDGRRVLVYGDDAVAWILDARTGHVLHTLGGHASWASIDTAAWSPDGRRIATGGDDAQVFVWNADTGRPAFDPISETNAVSAVAFNATGTALATAAGTRVHVWKTADGRQLAELRGHSDVVNDVEFRKGGKVLVTASDDGTARVWDYAQLTETTLRTLLGHTSFVDNAVFSPDGRSVLTGSADGTARIWDVATGLGLWRHYAGVLDAAFSPDGRRVLTGGRDRHLYLWSAHSGKFLRSLPDPPTSAVHSIRFSPDGRLVVTAEHNGIVTVRRTSDWMPIARIPAYPNPEIASPAAQAVFSPNGKQVAAISLNGWAGIFDSQTGDLIRWLSTTRHLGPAHPLGAGTGVAWSSDGRFVVTTATDSVLHVWNPSNGKLLATLRGHVGRASSPSFAPNSDLVVTAGADRTARVWNVATDRQVALLRGGVAAISAAAFSPDGRWVVTGDAAGVTDVWDWRRQKLLGALPMHSDYVNAVSFAPHGRRILSASNDSTAKIYTCNTCVSLARLRAIVDRREHVIDTYGW